MSTPLGAPDGQYIPISLALIRSRYIHAITPYFVIYLVLRSYVWRKLTDKPGSRIKLGAHYKSGNLVSMLTQASLARKAGVSESTAKRAVWALEQNGWLKQVREVTDRGPHNVLLLGQRTKPKGVKDFTGESYFADAAIAKVLAAEEKAQKAQKVQGAKPPPRAQFKTRTSKDYRADLAALHAVHGVTSDPSPSDSHGVTSDPSHGVTGDPSHGVTSDPAYNRELASRENLSNIHLPSEDGARKRAASENEVWLSPGSSEPRPSGAAAERDEKNKKHDESARESTTRAAPEMVPNCITHTDAGTEWVDAVPCASVPCASGDAPSEVSVMPPNKKQLQADRERQASLRGPPPTARPKEGPADKRDVSEGPKGRVKGSRAAKGPEEALEAPPTDEPKTDNPFVAPTSPYLFYGFFVREVQRKYPSAKLPPRSPKILGMLKNFLRQNFEPDALYEMVQVLVLDYENFEHMKGYFAYKGGPYPSLDQLIANASLLYRLIGVGVATFPTARVSPYLESYRRRQSIVGGPQGSLGAQPDAPAVPTDDQVKLDQLRERLKANPGGKVDG